MFGSDQIAKTPMVEPNCFQAKPVSIAKVSAVALHVRRCIYIYIYICTYIFNSDAVQWQHEYFIFTVLSGLVLHSEAMSGPTVCLRCSDLAPPQTVQRIPKYSESECHACANFQPCQIFTVQSFQSPRQGSPEPRFDDINGLGLVTWR